MLHNRSPVTSIIAIGIAVCLISISVGITFSITPLYITTVLGIAITSVGILEGITESLAQFFKLVSGVLVDYMKKKKPILVLSFIIAAISRPIFIMANGFNLILTSKILERLSNGLMATPRDIYIVEMSPANRKSTFLSIIMTFKFFGIITGSLLAAFLLYLTSEDYKLIMWIGFAISVFAVLILLLFMKEPQYSNNVEESIKERNIINWKELKNLPGYFWFLIIIATIFMCTRFSEAFLILYMDHLQFPKTISASFVAIQNLTAFITCTPFGVLSDKIGKKLTLSIIIAIHCLANACFILTSNLFIGILGVILWGTQRAVSQVLFISLISDIVGKNILGTAVGIFYLTTGFAALFASIAAGWIANNISFEYLFILGFFVSCISLALFVFTPFFGLFGNKNNFN